MTLPADVVLDVALASTICRVVALAYILVVYAVDIVREKMPGSFCVPC